ncbi:hypothetical protein [Rhizobium grahamii]|uniref:Uncharacterized protein n=1 Tax=Rhizobium grahamii CCGE 502 TaxID=990285 RepID=S3HHX2_9HYPH|nr:hypothetical protein [Rhizobium grahamii]EPE98427.1 hypothetical protein RGCCGE502_08370 [Rhizobium grahamii CCGE 502]
MTRTAELREAIIELARAKAEPGQPVNLLDLGPTLVVERNYSQDEVVNALFGLQADGVIQMLEGNRMVIVR